MMYTKAYCNGAIEDWCNISFSTKYSNPMYYVKHFNMLDENKEWYEVISITIPDSVTYIGSGVFADCTSLTIYCETDSKPYGWDDDRNISNCPVVWVIRNNNILSLKIL